MRISPVFITRDKADMLLRCLHEVPWGHPLLAEGVLVDNGSRDGTPDRVAEELPEIRLVRLHDNYGVTAARNIAASNAPGEILFFLDDDGRFNFACLERVAEIFREQEDVAVITGVVHHFSAEDIFALDVEDYLPDRPELEDVPTFKGGVCFVRRDRFMEVGMFPDDYFYGYEEPDLTYRLHRHGYRVVRLNEAVLLHRKIVTRSHNRRHFRSTYRNKVLTLWRNLPLGSALAQTARTAVTGLVGSAAVGHPLAFLRGFSSALVRIPRILRSERHPLSREQYRALRSRMPAREGLRKRLGRFLSDIRFRTRKDTSGSF